MIKLLVDSAADYPFEELKTKGIELCPMSITIGEESYIEGVNLERDQFYEVLVEGRYIPKTSQPAPQKFVEIFERIKADGDELICVLLASTLSGTYQSACIAKEMVEYDGIYLVDSQLATCCIKVVVDEALKWCDQGLSAQAIVERIEALKHRVKVLAMVDTLEYLARGGRLSKTAAAVGEIAKIKPVVTLAEDGNIEVVGKCLGKIKAMNFILKQLEKMDIDSSLPMYAAYSYGTADLEKFEGKLLENHYQLKNRVQVGSTIGTHTGPGVFGVIFVTKD